MLRHRWAVVAGVLFLTAAGAEARESYSGYVVPESGVFPRAGAQRMVITLESFTSTSDVGVLSETVRAKGQKGLEQELWEREVGRLTIGNGLSYPIASAQEFVDPELGTRKLQLLISRPVSYRELERSSRSTHYPFTLIELDLDGSGSGTGEVLPAAKVEVRKDGSVEIENLTARPLRVLKVQRTG